jgi:hypothetical protein
MFIAWQYLHTPLHPIVSESDSATLQHHQNQAHGLRSEPRTQSRDRVRHTRQELVVTRLSRLRVGMPGALGANGEDRARSHLELFVGLCETCCEPNGHTYAPHVQVVSVTRLGGIGFSQCHEHAADNTAGQCTRESRG